MFLSSNAKAPKIVAIVLLVTSALAILCSLVTLGFSWGGLDVDLNFEQIEQLQSKCAGTFGKQPNSIDTRSCEVNKCAEYHNVAPSECHGFQFCRVDHSQRSTECETCPITISMLNGSAYGRSCGAITMFNPSETDSCKRNCEPNVGKMVQVCGVSQFDAGCSSDYLRHRLYWHGASGAIAATVSSVFVLVTSIPVMINGIFGLVKKDLTSKISGGIALGFAGCTCCATFICMISTLTSMGIADDIADSLNEAYSEEALPCTSECKASVEARQVLDEEVKDYFGVLTGMCVTLLFLSLAEIIVAAFSFSLFNRRVFDSRRECASSTRSGATETHSEEEFHTQVVVQNAVIVDADGQVVQPIAQAEVMKVNYPPVAAAVPVVVGTVPAPTATTAAMATATTVPT